jgi:eukaryotic-like serine/threonine-protein kinase
MKADLREHLQTTLGAAYSIGRELGGGGMSRVFAAEERAFGRNVVVKVLPPELSSAVSADRFRREIQIAARLQHPHIVPLLGAGEAEGLLYYTMPLVEGESLRERLQREKQLPIEDAVRIACEVGDALDYAHRHSILHRDIKPENILIEDGHAVVTDFGIARALLHAGGTEPLTSTGLTVGTPAYVSPEQAAGEQELDGRTDIYSLACVLYEMLAGEPPFNAATAQAAIAKRFKEPVASLHSLRDAVPPALERAIVRALSLAPADRFPTARAFAEALSSAVARGRTTKRGAAGRPHRASASRSARRVIRSPYRIAAYLVAGVIAALVAYTTWRWQSGSRRPSGDPGTQTAVLATRAASRSIAVLPFVNMSADPENEYFADGMTEELINALTKVEGLRVPARTSSFAFKGKDLTIRAIADSLDVGSVLEGSVRRAANRLKVTAQLINAADGYHLWSETYERELKDVFAVQDEIARAIVTTLRVRLTGPAASGIVRQPTHNLEAYELYLKGRFAWSQRTSAALEQAARHFEQAIMRDSQFAQAHAGLADTFILLPLYGGVAPTEAWAKAKAAALMALELDSTLVEARTSLAYGTMKHDWAWEAAERGFKQAIALNPHYATARHWYGDFLTGRGRLEEALRELKRAQELDPLSRIIGSDLGRALLFQKRNAEAVAQLEQTVRLDPGFARARLWLATAYLQTGMRSEAVAQLQQSVELSGREPVAVANLAYAYAVTGNVSASSSLLAELRARARREYVLPSALAMAHMGQGDREEALASLKRAVDTRDPWLAENIFDPRFGSLSSDSRFPELLRRMGLNP